jgi:5-methylcytosine-specific restriction endonuclease McrA
MASVYDSLRWRAARARTLRRDGNRCTVARLLGGECSAMLHVHHIRPIVEGGDPFADENLATACESHHPMWEALRRRLLGVLDRELERPVSCPHQHRTAEGRRACEARRARQRTVAA